MTLECGKLQILISEKYYYKKQDEICYLKDKRSNLRKSQQTNFLSLVHGLIALEMG